MVSFAAVYEKDLLYALMIRKIDVFKGNYWKFEVSFEMRASAFVDWIILTYNCNPERF